MRWWIALGWISVVGAAVPVPKVTGPIPATAAPGDPSHNYPFLSMQEEIARFDYVEEEFYIEGNAVAYEGTGENRARLVANRSYPYKTRAVVRRPRAADKFNGTVILEWINVTLAWDKELDWLWSHEHLMRRGFAHVAVSAQALGIDSPTGLKAWNASRYGSLDVTARGTFSSDELSFSIFSQTAQAARDVSGSGLLGGLRARSVVATGDSQSAVRLVTYYNSIHSQEQSIDGFVLHGPGNSGKLRTDVQTPVWKLLSETDVLRRQATERQPDTAYIRTWEVAGAAHGGWDISVIVDRLAARDLGGSNIPPDACGRPILSRVRSYLVQDSVYDWIKRWVEDGTQPPHAPPIEISSLSKVAGVPSEAVRDEHGNALGGIRLAEIEVPVATNTGMNTGQGFSCTVSGSHEPFDAAKLERLYPSHAEYVAKVTRVTEENLKAGYITNEGAEETKREAPESKIGR